MSIQDKTELSRTILYRTLEDQTGQIRTKHRYTKQERTMRDCMKYTRLYSTKKVPELRTKVDYTGLDRF